MLNQVWLTLWPFPMKEPISAYSSQLVRHCSGCLYFSSPVSNLQSLQSSWNGTQQVLELLLPHQIPSCSSLRCFLLVIHYSVNLLHADWTGVILTSYLFHSLFKYRAIKHHISLLNAWANGEAAFYLENLSQRYGRARLVTAAMKYVCRTTCPNPKAIPYQHGRIGVID